MELESIGIDGVVNRIRERVDDAPLYLSIDIDVLDPAHAPGTGTPEAGGLTSRELLGILRGLAGTRPVGADVVEDSRIDGEIGERAEVMPNSAALSGR